MLTKQISDEVRQEIEDFGRWRSADGVVMSTLSLADVIKVVAHGGFLEIEYLRVHPGRRVVEVGDSVELVTRCTIETYLFGHVRELDIQPDGGGVFDFEASHDWHSPGKPNGPTGPGQNFRFHVNNKGRATYVVA
jgi:hypothetical protein